MRYFKKISLLLLAVFIMTTGFGCIWDIGPPKDQIKPITLEYWGVWDTKHQLSSLINDYQANHLNIDFKMNLETAHLVSSFLNKKADYLKIHPVVL